MSPLTLAANGVEMSDGWLLNLEQRTNAKIREGKERKKDVEYYRITAR